MTNFHSKGAVKQYLIREKDKLRHHDQYSDKNKCIFNVKKSHVACLIPTNKFNELKQLLNKYVCDNKDIINVPCNKKYIQPAITKKYDTCLNELSYSSQKTNNSEIFMSEISSPPSPKIVKRKKYKKIINSSSSFDSITFISLLVLITIILLKKYYYV